VNFWDKLSACIQKGEQVALLLVLESSGSSPGRQGFKMAVSDAGEMFGSIGGGIMEHKLVELAKSKLAEGRFDPFLKRQIHKAEAEKDRSGMICSGEQVIAFYFLNRDDEAFARAISQSSKKRTLRATQAGLMCDDDSAVGAMFNLEITSDTEWSFTEQMDIRNTAYIFGGGHVGLAMSRMMSTLDFRVVVFDDREGLNTIEQNVWADEIRIIDYQKSDEHVEEGEHSYVIIMSFGYKPDEVIIRRLLGKSFKYIGLMGSQSKIDKMWKALKKDGFKAEDLDRVHSPIGVPIHSKTPDEIAVSIAAQIIGVKNQGS